MEPEESMLSRLGPAAFKHGLTKVHEMCREEVKQSTPAGRDLVVWLKANAETMTHPGFGSAGQPLHSGSRPPDLPHQGPQLGPISSL